MCKSFVRYLKRLAFFFLFLFFLYSEQGWIYLYLFLPFCLVPRPRLPFYRKLHQAMGGFKLSFLVCFEHFSEKVRGGWWISPPEFVHWSPFVHGNHTGAFLVFYFFFPRGGQRVARKRLRKGKKCSAAGEFSSPSWRSGAGRGPCCGGSGGHIELYIVAIFFYYSFPAKWST